MVSVNAREKLGREFRRTYKRVNAQRLLERAEYLPQVERLLIEQTLGQGMTVESLAVLQRVSANSLTQKLRRLRERLADPCFILATQFADRLPEGLRPVARSFYGDALTLQACAVRHELTLHQLRQALYSVRCLLMLLKSEARAGRLQVTEYKEEAEAENDES